MAHTKKRERGVWPPRLTQARQSHTRVQLDLNGCEASPTIEVQGETVEGRVEQRPPGSLLKVSATRLLSAAMALF